MPLLVLLIIFLLVAFIYNSNTDVQGTKSKYIQMLKRNLSKTLPVIFLCIALSYLLSLIVNLFGGNDDAVDFLFKHSRSTPSSSSTSPAMLDRYYWIRNFFLILGAAIGLISSQLSFIATAILGKEFPSDNMKIENPVNPNKENI